MSLLEDNRVAIHDFIIGELACGQLKQRQEVLALLDTLPRFEPLPHGDVLFMVASRELSGSGIGWVDSHLLASVLESKGRIWSLDKSLNNVAKKLSVGFE